MAKKILAQVNFDAPGLASKDSIVVIDIDDRSGLPKDPFWRRRFRDEVAEDLRIGKDPKTGKPLSLRRVKAVRELDKKEVDFIAALAKGSAPETKPKADASGTKGS